MINATIENFVPFPGNYFMYDFPKPFDGEAGANFILSIKGHPNFAIEAKLIQRVDLGDIIRTQVTATAVFHIHSSGNFERIDGSFTDTPVSNDEKLIYKRLLQKWDPEEFSDENNHYFQRIDGENNIQGFSNLIGGAISRPGKFPFDKVSTQVKAVTDRINVLTANSTELKLKLLKKIIEEESFLALEK